MQGLKMRPNPEPHKLSAQGELLAKISAMKKEGLGWEDIEHQLRMINMPVARDHLRRFVLGVRS